MRNSKRIAAISVALLAVLGSFGCERAVEQVGSILRDDLDRLASAGIPVDVVFEQGPQVLGL